MIQELPLYRHTGFTDKRNGRGSYFLLYKIYTYFWITGAGGISLPTGKRPAADERRYLHTDRFYTGAAGS